MNYFQDDPLTAREAKAQAQRIAFAPIVFQACRVLRDCGILEQVRQSGNVGMTLGEIVAQVGLSRYGIKVLLESGLGIGLFYLNHDRFVLTKLGYFLLRDPMTRVNMDVMHEVCYRGFFVLDQAIEEGRPAGLKTLGDWKTLYEGLTAFPPRAHASWLAFNHYYSDIAFPAALQLVFKAPPRRLLDVGGNTGRWAIQCTTYYPAVRVTIADLPQQLELAYTEIHKHGLADLVDFFPIDMLDELQSLPTGYDAIWMSQFLSCFSEQEIVSILKRTALSMSDSSTLYILELFWDRQPHATAAFCLQQISLYFTCIANGNSQIYHSTDLLRCLEESGLQVIEDHDEVGDYHTLLKCRKA
jgi:hypothetical protein